MNSNITKFLDNERMAGTPENTISTYGGHIDRLYRHLQALGHEVEAADGSCLISAEMMQSFYASLFGRGLKPATRNNYVSALHNYFSYLEKLGKLDRNPTAILKFAKPEYNPRLDGNTVYDDDALIRLFSEIRLQRPILRERNLAFVCLALATAMRASELCSLEMADLKEIQGGSVRVKIKGGRHEEIAVASFAVQPILNYVAMRPDCADTSALFITQKGTELDRKQAHDHLASAQRYAGATTGLHIFRHTTLTRVNRFGDAMSRDIARHRITSVTDRYTHTTVQERKMAIESVYAALFKDMGTAS